MHKKEGETFKGGGGQKTQTAEVLICDLLAKADGWIPGEECLCDDEMIAGEGIVGVERVTLIFEEVGFCVLKTFREVGRCECV